MLLKIVRVILLIIKVSFVRSHGTGFPYIYT